MSMITVNKAELYCNSLLLRCHCCDCRWSAGDASAIIKECGGAALCAMAMVEINLNIMIYLVQ